MLISVYVASTPVSTSPQTRTLPTAPVAESPDTTIGISTMPIAPDAETPVNVTVMGMAAWAVPNAVVAASPVKVTVTPVPSKQ